MRQRGTEGLRKTRRFVALSPHGNCSKNTEDQLKIDDINVETKLITVTTDLPAEEVIEQLKKTGKEIKQVQ